MSEQSAPPETGALSVDQAIASLLPAAEPVEQNEPASEAPEGAAETPENTEGESSSPEGAAEGAENPEDGEEAAETPEPEKLAAPLYWKPDAKAKFDALDPELQAEILAQEGPREESAAKAKADAAKQVEAASAELGKVNELAAALAERLPKWVETFTSRWGTKPPDWAAVAQEHGVEAMTLAKVQYEAERQQLQEAEAETNRAQQIAHQTFLQTEWKALAELAPALAPDVSDPKKGAETRQAVVKYLEDYGIPKTAIPQISARELTLAHKAMLYDQGQAALKAAPKPKPAPQAQRTPVRPGAGQQASSPSSIAKAATGRFHQAPTIDNAVAMLLASKG